VAQPRALGRERTGVSVYRMKPFRVTIAPSSPPFLARLDVLNGFKIAVPVLLGAWLPTLPSQNPKQQASGSIARSPDRRASGFLQVVPIETASVKASHHSCEFTSEAVPIGR
jgi:hypothetical protein